VSLLDQAGGASEVLYGAICALFDRVIAAECAVPVIAFDHRAPSGVIVIRLPVPETLAQEGAAC
jgi:hypothetical protein